MPSVWYDAEVIQVLEHSSRLRSIRFIPDQMPTFKAGQFVTFDLPVAEKRVNRWRSYSLANPPDTNDYLEICLNKVPGGMGSTFLFEHIQIGSKLKFKEPEGSFTLENLQDKEIIMLATGTGVVPFRSMLMDPKRKVKSAHLIYGTRYKEDLLYEIDFAQLKQSWRGFKYDICLSKEPNWNGNSGHIHDIYQKIYTHPEPNRMVLVCGLAPMIDEAVAILIKNKIATSSQIKYELYGM